MKDFFKNKFGTILVLLATVVLAGIAIFTAYRLYKLRQEAIAPNAPTSRPAAAECNEQCPGSDKILRNCTPPDSDGTSDDSICNNTTGKGDIKPCGGHDYCCNGTNWVTNLTSCQTSASPSPAQCDTLSFILSEVSPSPSSSSSVSPSPSLSPSTTASATASPTNTTAAPTGTATSQNQAELPKAGTSLPSILGLGAGGILLIVSLLLAL